MGIWFRKRKERYLKGETNWTLREAQEIRDNWFLSSIWIWWVSLMLLSRSKLKKMLLCNLLLLPSTKVPKIFSNLQEVEVIWFLLGEVRLNSKIVKTWSYLEIHWEAEGRTHQLRVQVLDMWLAKILVQDWKRVHQEKAW